jgi:inosine-uridine nucleoside N-ribohydrolase
VSKRRIWIDTDPAITAGNGEVDDAFALIQALRSPEFEIVGISAVFGNTGIDHTYAMAREIVRRAGRDDVPVYCGSGIEGDRSGNAATDGLNVALADAPLTILALGPLTTIAAALLQPEANRAHVDELVFVGGRRQGLEFRATPSQEKPFRDMNFECDPAAAAALLELNIPITLAGWEVCSQMWLTPSDLDHLRDEGDACAHWLSESARTWQRDWQRDFAAPGFTPFDTLAVGWLIMPEAYEALTWPCTVSHDGKRPLMVVDPDGSGVAVTYLRSVNNEKFHDDLMARLLRC